MLNIGAHAQEGVGYIYSSYILIALLGLTITWLSMLLKRGIWVYVFLLLLIASFSDKVRFGSFILEFSVGPLDIDVIALSLIISHILLNASTFRVEQSDEEIKSDFESKVEYFMKQYSSKTTDELERMSVKDIVPEAKEAIKRIREI